MINKLKIGIFLGVLSLMAVAGVQSANAQALTFDHDTSVTIDGETYVIKSGSEATSVVVGATTLVAVVPADSTFTLTAEQGNTLTNVDGGAVVTAQSCVNATNTVAYTGAGTITFTPTTVVACATPSSGGGGRSSSSSNAATPAVPANEEAPADCLAGYQFSPSTGRNCNAAAPAIPAGCTTATSFSPLNGQKCPTVMNTNTNTTVVLPGNAQGHGFAFGLTTIKNGSSGEACRAWQSFFNSSINAQLAVDSKCGPKTMAAARTWQASAGLVADGLLGPASRAKATMQGNMTTPAQ